ncbi:uncharacterized protein LOC135218575 [Macrobrachium nipponense]|uniref:uncharacterized protein LOC135218575 n=1 Tax=Macrobrachium nipponense TaxID=159736 RepID=UPI0030C7D065
MVNAKGIGIIMLVALGIAPYCAHSVPYEPPDDLVEEDGNQDFSPITAQDGEQTQEAQESAPHLEQNLTQLLEEEKPVETSADNFSVALTDQDLKQSHNSPLTPLNQIEDLKEILSLYHLFHTNLLVQMTYFILFKDPMVFQGHLKFLEHFIL